MTAEQAITQAAAYAAVARSNGDEAGEAYWTQRVMLLSDQHEARNARLTDSIARLEARDA